jgi:hypothetical protein
MDVPKRMSEHWDYIDAEKYRRCCLALQLFRNGADTRDLPTGDERGCRQVGKLGLDNDCAKNCQQSLPML